MPNRPQRRIGVLGAGSWGTALAVHFAAVGGHQVTLWARHKELAAQMASQRLNADYLPGVTLPERLHPTSSTASWWFWSFPRTVSGKCCGSF
jgi:glycerol-3-phosphate dehydrogenase (NAD(P)+)